MERGKEIPEGKLFHLVHDVKKGARRLVFQMDPFEPHKSFTLVEFDPLLDVSKLLEVIVLV